MLNKTLQNRIESVMAGPHKTPAFSLATVLYWLSRVYGAFQNLRSTCYRKHLIHSRKLPCPVISIGNMVVGGTGKTPMTVFMAGRLRQLGYRVLVISRGYKGTARNAVTMVSDGQSVCVDPETAGDEPYLLACRLKGIPVMVGSNRFAVGQLAMERFQPEVIILDDGFQHLQLARDLDLILLDYRKPFGNRHLLPRGTLREPQSALKRCSAIVLTRCPAAADPQSLLAEHPLKDMPLHPPVFSTSHVPSLYRVPRDKQVSPAGLSAMDIPDPPGAGTHHPVAAFSGIARNDDFRQTLESLGFYIAYFAEFPDHHWYSDRDLAAIEKAAQQASARYMVTTEKDYMRIAHRKTWPLDLIVVGVRISFGEDEERFLSFLENKIRDIN